MKQTEGGGGCATPALDAAGADLQTFHPFLPFHASHTAPTEASPRQMA